MRLPPLPPSSLSSEQKELYDDIMGGVKEDFGSFIAAREDGALIGPELSRLGRSALQIPQIIVELKKKQVNVYTIKGAWTLKVY